jgi:hypothetical protein
MRAGGGGGPTRAGGFAGVSAVALGLAGLLLPAHRATVTPAAPPCTPATSGAAAGGYTLCLSVTQTTGASKLLPGHDADFSIGVWLAGQPAAPSPSASPTDTASPSPAPPSPSPAPSAAAVTVTLTPATGGPVPRFLTCPAAVSNGTCQLGTLTAGSPATGLAADVAIPATAAAGQTITFTIATGTSTAGVGTPSAPQSFTVAAPPVPPSPAATSPAATSPAATSPAATASPAAAAQTPAAGPTLPAGIGTPPVITPVPALGPLPGPVATGGVATFPVVAPESSPAPAAAASRQVPLRNVSAQFPLAGSQLGLRFGSIALAAAFTSLGTAWLTLRRRPRRGSRGPKHFERPSLTGATCHRSRTRQNRLTADRTTVDRAS